MTSPTPPTAVLFDVGDTLLVEQRFDLEAGIAAVVRQSDDVTALAEAFRTELLACHKARRELRLASWLQHSVPALAGHAVDEIEDRIWPAVVTLYPCSGIVGVLQRLARDGVRMAAISNAAFSGRVLLAELTRHELGAFFQFVLSSADLGVRKPAPAIYHVALKRLRAQPYDTWFVGDTLDEDIAGAINVGLTGFLLQPAPSERDRSNGQHVVRRWQEFADAYTQAARPLNAR
jgi:HAD superfamily hydrolase (TIGR01509 family)